MDIKALIEKTIKDTTESTVNEVISELKRQRLLKGNRQTPFQKTEILLYNYNNFKQVLKNKYDEIDFIKEEGIFKKSSSFIQARTGISIDTSNDYERMEYAIERIQQTIIETEMHIKKIDTALETIEEDPYFDIIRLKYFEEKTREQMAEYFDVDVSTISRNKNRLINQLQISLFSNEVLADLFVD